jgi:HPr kinase/phosphorylase
MSDTRPIHASAVAIGGDALLLRGPSGAGKSDLALRMIGLEAVAIAFPCSTYPPTGPALSGKRANLVADDQVRLVRDGDDLIASAPQTIRGLIEVRGLGIVRMPSIEQARVRLIIDLVPIADVPRMPPEADTVDLLGVMIPRLKLYAFEASAPLKCALALRDAVCAAARSSVPSSATMQTPAT